MNKPFDKSLMIEPVGRSPFALDRCLVSEACVEVLNSGFFETQIWALAVSSHESLNNIVEHACSEHEILCRYALINSMNGLLHFRV